MVLPIIFAAINRSLFTGISFAICFVAMTTGYTFSISEKNGMERLYGILPISKKYFVIGRYLYTGILGGISLLFSGIVHPIVLKKLGVTVPNIDIVLAIFLGIILFSVYTVFQLPGYYKYGSINGRVFMYIPVAGFLILLLALQKVDVSSIYLLNTVPNIYILVIGAILLVSLMYYASIMISIKIVKNKEI